MREFLFRLSGTIPALVLFIAILFISYGAWLLSHPAGYIVFGVLLILALVDSRT
jgi:uncharacterized membrane protein